MTICDNCWISENIKSLL